jgi:hypothetical protein
MKSLFRKIVIILFLFFTMGPNKGYSHAWTQSNICFLWMNRYTCNANTQVYLYTQTVNEWWWWFGWHHRQYQVPVYTSPCSQSDWGCSRPRHANCTTNWYFAGTGWRAVVADSYWPSSSGPSNWVWSNDWRLTGGSFGDVKFDENTFNQLDHEGSYSVNMQGDATISANASGSGNVLNISDITGFVGVKPGSNFTSTYHILVVKQRNDLSQDEVNKLKQYEQDMHFSNEFTTVLSESSITVSKKAGIVVSGFLGGLVNASNMDSTQSDTLYQVAINHLNGSVRLPDANLAANEAISYIQYSDGGFDFSLCPPNMTGVMVSDSGSFDTIQGRAAMQGVATTQSGPQLAVYPNPTHNSVSLRYVSAKDNSDVEITLVDLTGRTVKALYMGKSCKGECEVNNLDISSVPSGNYFVKVKMDGQSYNVKVTKQ